MAEVYQIDKDILCCYQNGQHYYGFERGSETRISATPVKLYGNELNIGDKIKGFDSGKERTSFILDYGFMTYMGAFSGDLLFEINDPKQKQVQLNLFQPRPKWMLSFSLIGEQSGVLMHSAPGCCYDIHPLKIIKA